MKLKHTFLVLLASTAVVGGARSAAAQAGVPSTPAQTDTIRVAPAQGSPLPATPTQITAGTPVATDTRADTTVYLSQDYMKVLATAKLFDSDKFTAVFVGFQNEFAVFKQANSREQIYIPKTAILYMRGPGEPRVESR